MGVVALILAIIAILVSLLPTFGSTQMVGLALGAIALFLALSARGRAKEAGRGLGVATAAISFSVVAVTLSVLVFATCQVMTHEMGEKLGSELKRGGRTKGAPSKPKLSDPKSR